MITANIEWDFVPGSLYTTVEYKLANSPTWIIPTVPTNPTTQNTYILELQENTYYDVRLTTTGIKCAPKSRTIRILTESLTNNCCPSGYTLSEDGTHCYQYLTVAATAPTGQQTTVAKADSAYGIYGTAIYDAGYGSDGTGTFTIIPFSNTFWVNGNGFGSGANTTNSANNRTGLWATSMLPNQDVGFTVCVNAPTPGTYYVGCMGDNRVKITLDGATVLNMIPTNIRDYYATHGYPGIDIQVTFRFWHVYPVYLTAGDHTITIIGHNDSDIAAMGAEVYNATAAELMAATSYAALGSKLLFSSKDYIGQNVQIGSGGIGYTCPTNYDLVMCDGPAYCKRRLQTPLIPC